MSYPLLEFLAFAFWGPVGLLRMTKNEIFVAIATPIPKGPLMTTLLCESLLVAEYFKAYDQALREAALDGKCQVRSQFLDVLYHRLASQAEKVGNLTSRLVDCK